MENSKIKVWVYLNSQDNTSVVGTYMLMDDCYEDRDFGIIIGGNVFNLKKRYVQFEAEVVEDDNGTRQGAPHYFTKVILRTKT